MSTEEIYRKLQKHLDNMPVGFPATKSGVEIKLLKHLFTPEEAEIALYLSAIPEPLERIHKRIRKDKDLSLEELEQVLDRLVQKGAIMGGKLVSKGQSGKRYSKALLAIGMYEFQVNKLTEGFARDFKQYLDEAFADELFGKKTFQMRTIPVNKSIPVAPSVVAPYDDVRQIVQNSPGPFTVFNCVCRQTMDKLGQPCERTDIRETCLGFQEIAQFLIESGTGREISREEMMDLLERAEGIGLVLQPENTRNPRFICCCCGCCCTVLVTAKRFPRPAKYFHTNFFAEVDSEACTGCGKCQRRCQMGAVAVVDGMAQVDLDRCIGCGLCTTACSTRAIQLRKKKKEAVPPRDGDTLYRKIAMERFGLGGTLKIMGKAALGMKI